MTAAQIVTPMGEEVATQPIRIALVGNPNCGKTAMFNALTGARQKVANYAGVTVERKEGRLTTEDGHTAIVLDLPGTYSLRARSPDEVVTRDAVLGRLEGETTPDVIVCVADATNLRLVLRLALELKAVGRPVVLALNMIDIAERQGRDIDIEGLASDLGVPVLTTVATRRRGVEALASAAIAAASAHATAPSTVTGWTEPSASELRRLHLAAERIFKKRVHEARRPDTLTGRIDDVLLHPVAGIAILLIVLFAMFQAVFVVAKPFMDLITAAVTALSAGAAMILPDGLLKSLICDGVIAGVGSVLVFLPQIMILFLFIILLEDVGYMARAAFLLDRVMGFAGLHGRAFIPLLSSFACAIPGVMSARVIDNRRDRLTTIMAAPLMTCSARIAVYTLIISAFIPDKRIFGFVNLQGLVFFSLYAAGMIGALLVAWVMRRLIWRSASEPFLMELPAYKRPEFVVVMRSVAQRGQIFLTRAGTTILFMMVLIWFVCQLPGPPPGATEPAINYSFAGMIGRAVQPFLAPIGFSWQMSVALIPGLAAREVAIGALGAIYAVSGGESGGHPLLAANLAHHWSMASALAFLAWYVFAPQCASTLAVVKRETGSWIWPAIMFGYMFALAYAAAFVVYRIAVSVGMG